MKLKSFEIIVTPPCTFLNLQSPNLHLWFRFCKIFCTVQTVAKAEMKIKNYLKFRCTSLQDVSFIVLDSFNVSAWGKMHSIYNMPIADTNNKKKVMHMYLLVFYIILRAVFPLL